MEIITSWESRNFQEIIDLYNSVEWTAYTDNPENLKNAFENTDLVLLAIEENGLIGLSRSLSDGVSIHYLQDILVHPDFQKKGVGRALLEKALDYYTDVRTHMILTDNEEKQIKFYESLGYKNTKDLRKMPLNSFVKIKGLELS